MNEIKIKLENLSDAEQEQLMKLIEKANSPVCKVWKPKHGEEYYYINEFGVGLTKWNNNFSQDLLMYEIGNLFRSEEEAEEEIKRRKILKRWKDLSIESGEAENEWSSKNLHWYCYYEYSMKRIQFWGHYDIVTANIYFATKESLERAIIELGEENVKKYILGVKE